MKLSLAIEKMQNILNEFGDLPVKVSFPNGPREGTKTRYCEAIEPMRFTSLVTGDTEDYVGVRAWGCEDASC